MNAVSALDSLNRPEFVRLGSFALVAIALSCTPGLNMVFLLATSASRGLRAGFASLAGIAAVHIVYMLATVIGLTVLIVRMPHAHQLVRYGGAAILSYAAVQAISPDHRFALERSDIPGPGDWESFRSGLAINAANPKAALVYLSLMPQFLDQERGEIAAQTVALGSLYIVISLSINAVLVTSAAPIHTFLDSRPGWRFVQRWTTAGVLGALAGLIIVE